MEDGERIAELIGAEHYYNDDWEKIKAGNQPNVSPKDAQWVYDVANRIIKILPELGYTRQYRHTPETDGILGVCNTHVSSVGGQEKLQGKENTVLPVTAALSKSGEQQIPEKPCSKSNDGTNDALSESRITKRTESDSIGLEIGTPRDKAKNEGTNGYEQAMSRNKNSLTSQSEIRTDVSTAKYPSPADAGPRPPSGSTTLFVEPQEEGIQPPTSSFAVKNATTRRDLRTSRAREAGVGHKPPAEPSAKWVSRISPYEIPHAAYDKYFTPPEPPQDKVEAIRKILDGIAYNRIVSDGIIHEILKLIEPVKENLG